ncbi:MAG: hypothetical protein Q7S88_01375 [Candidatus Daviesbacteria bacterium]|nr:hypothetical protein [Candidatus Daviesbacteria bacterium]
MYNPEDKAPFLPENIEWKNVSLNPGQSGFRVSAEQDDGDVNSFFEKVLVPVNEYMGPHIKLIRTDRMIKDRLERVATETLRLVGPDLLVPNFSTRIRVSRNLGVKSRLVEVNYSGQDEYLRLTQTLDNQIYSASATYDKSGDPHLFCIKRLRTPEKWAEIQSQMKVYMRQSLGENGRQLVVNFIHQNPAMPAFLPDVNLCNQAPENIEEDIAMTFRNKQKRNDIMLAKWPTEVQREVLGKLGEISLEVAGFYREPDFTPSKRAEFMKSFEEEMMEYIPRSYDLYRQEARDKVWKDLAKKTLVALLIGNYTRLSCLEEYGVMKELTGRPKIYEFRVQHETYGSIYVSSEPYNNEHSYDEVKLDLLTNPRSFVLTVRNRQGPRGFTRVEFDKKIKVPRAVSLMRAPDHSWIGTFDLFKGDIKTYDDLASS